MTTRSGAVIDTTALPTHLALVARRLNVIGMGGSGDTFLHASYLVEATIKTLTVALYAGLREGSADDAYAMGHFLIKADGLGTWDTAFRQCTTPPMTGFLAREFQPVVAWATKKRTKPEDAWFMEAKRGISTILTELGSEADLLDKASTIRDLVSSLVHVRNKTKAHGAVGQDFFTLANGPYINSIKLLLANCPLIEWTWIHAHQLDHEQRETLLLGSEPSPFVSPTPVRYSEQVTGIFVIPTNSPRAILCPDLLISNVECSSFGFANGGLTTQGYAEYIDYATGRTTKSEIKKFVVPPPPLPASETEGTRILDVQSNVFGNLPAVPKGYIERPDLQRRLRDRLLDKNHAIITLHGRGGVGKTSLALFAAHQLAAESSPAFDHILWFSARDIDLRTTGPIKVKPAIQTLISMSEAYGRMFGESGFSTVQFAETLRGSGLEERQRGTLFIFDNFETMTDVRGIHEFLDTHTMLPNKVLITSRERAFVADYPIEVRGMEFDEARAMLTSQSRDLGIEGLVTAKVIQDIYDYAEGHAYVMRVLLGETAREGRYMPAAQVISKRSDIVDAVFERSFNKLSDSGRYIFLITEYASGIGHPRREIREPRLAPLLVRAAAAAG